MTTFTEDDGHTMEVTTFDTFVQFDAIDSMDGERATLHLERKSVTALLDKLNAWLIATDPPASAAPTCCTGEDSSTCCPGPDQSESVAIEAHAAVYGDRQTDYGHPREDFTRAAVIWTGLLQHKLAEGAYIEPDDIGRCMIGTKLARDVHSPKRDNRVDIAGYAITLDRLETGR